MQPVPGREILLTASHSPKSFCSLKDPVLYEWLDSALYGLSLCPNLHRAFDRGLVRIDADYRVVVSSRLVESESGYSIKAFAGKRIRLPQDREFWPGLENLARHWRRWG